MAELFPEDSSVPAVPPRHPPVVAEPYYELCCLAVEAAKVGPRIDGKLAEVDIVGFLVADQLGRELLGARTGPAREQLKLGESVQKMAVKFATEAKPIKNNISARKSKARQAAAKSEEKAAGLEEKVTLLDKECEADLSDLRALVVGSTASPLL